MIFCFASSFPLWNLCMIFPFSLHFTLFLFTFSSLFIVYLLFVAILKGWKIKEFYNKIREERKRKNKNWGRLRIINNWIVVQTKLYSFKFDCKIVSFTAANTNLMFSVSKKCKEEENRNISQLFGTILSFSLNSPLPENILHINYSKT